MAEQEPEKPRGGFMNWLKYAFAVDKYDESSLSETDKDVLSRVAKRIHEKQLTPAAILWAHSHRHMNFIGSQLLVFARPIFDLTHPVLNSLLGRFGMHISPADYPKLQIALEKRYSIEYFVQQLEALSAGDYNTRSAADGAEEQPPADNPPEDKDQG